MKPRAQRVRWSRQVLGCNSRARSARDSPLPRVIPLLQNCPRLPTHTSPWSRDTAPACWPARDAPTARDRWGRTSGTRCPALRGPERESIHPPTHPRHGPQRGRPAVRPFLVREVEEGAGVSRLPFLSRSKLACVAFPLATKSLQ